MNFPGVLAALSDHTLAVAVTKAAGDEAQRPVVCIFDDKGRLLHEIQNPGSPSNWFGSAIQAMGSDRFAVAAPAETVRNIGKAGCVYIYAADGRLERRIDNPAPCARITQFGCILAADPEGRFLATGSAPSKNTHASSVVHVFSPDGTLLATIENPVARNAIWPRMFPMSLALSPGGRLAVGSELNDLYHTGERVDLFQIEPGGKP